MFKATLFVYIGSQIRIQCITVPIIICNYKLIVIYLIIFETWGQVRIKMKAFVNSTTSVQYDSRRH